MSSLCLLLGVVFLVFGLFSDGGVDNSAQTQAAIFGVGLLVGAVIFGIWGSRRYTIERNHLRQPCPHSSAELNHFLRQAFDFTSDDLAANRKGSLSPAQHERMTQLFTSSRRWSSVFTAIMLIFLIGMWVFLFFATDVREYPPAVLSFSAIIGVMVVLIVAGHLRAARYSRDFDQQTIQSAEGRARLYVRQHRGITTYTLKIGGKTFHLTGEQSKGIWNGGEYRLFYLPYAPIHVLLSGEVV